MIWGAPGVALRGQNHTGCGKNINYFSVAEVTRWTVAGQRSDTRMLDCNGKSAFSAKNGRMLRWVCKSCRCWRLLFSSQQHSSATPDQLILSAPSLPCVSHRSASAAVSPQHHSSSALPCIHRSFPLLPFPAFTSACVSTHGNKQQQNQERFEPARSSFYVTEIKKPSVKKKNDQQVVVNVHLCKSRLPSPPSP